MLALQGTYLPPLDGHAISFGLGPGPSFLIRERRGGEHALLYFRPGDTTIHFSRTGDGPGEVRDAALLNVQGDTLGAYDFANQRIARWTESGQPLGETRLQELVIVSMPGRPGEWLGMRHGRNGLLPVSLSIPDGKATPLVSTSDSFWTAVAKGDSREMSPLISAGVWDSGFLIADGQGYRIGEYDWDGNLRFMITPNPKPNLPDAARLEELVSEWRRSGRPGKLSEAARRHYFKDTPEQWFSHLAPPRLDGAGRLWVVGKQSGRTFADAWWRGTLLGRTWLDCPGPGARWQLTDNMIAMTCEPDDPGSIYEEVYKVWQIRDSTGDTAQSTPKM
ncbi:MAG: hypothetical protein ABI542_11550 [Gemmatimonadota bacterium]